MKHYIIKMPHHSTHRSSHSRSHHSSSHTHRSSPSSKPSPQVTSNITSLPIIAKPQPAQQSSPFLWGLWGYWMGTTTHSYRTTTTTSTQSTNEPSCTELLASYQRLLLSSTNINELDRLKANLLDKCPQQSQSLNL
jgi:hypothetical protein